MVLKCFNTAFTQTQDAPGDQIACCHVTYHSTPLQCWHQAQICTQKVPVHKQSMQMSCPQRQDRSKKRKWCMYEISILTCYLVIPYPMKEFALLSLKYCFYLATELTFNNCLSGHKRKTSSIFFKKNWGGNFYPWNFYTLQFLSMQFFYYIITTLIF